MMKWVTGKEEQLLESWRELTPEKQQQVLEFVEALKSQSKTTEANKEYIPQTPLAKKLWEIRQRAIAHQQHYLINILSLEHKVLSLRQKFLSLEHKVLS